MGSDPLGFNWDLFAVLTKVGPPPCCNTSLLQHCTKDRGTCCAACPSLPQCFGNWALSLETKGEVDFESLACNKGKTKDVWCMATLCKVLLVSGRKMKVPSGGWKERIRDLTKFMEKNGWR